MSVCQLLQQQDSLTYQLEIDDQEGRLSTIHFNKQVYHFEIVFPFHQHFLLFAILNVHGAKRTFKLRYPLVFLQIIYLFKFRKFNFKVVFSFLLVKIICACRMSIQVNRSIKLKKAHWGADFSYDSFLQIISCFKVRFISKFQGGELQCKIFL